MQRAALYRKWLWVAAISPTHAARIGNAATLLREWTPDPPEGCSLHDAQDTDGFDCASIEWIEHDHGDAKVEVGLYAAATASMFALASPFALPGVCWYGYRTYAALQKMDRLSPARRLESQARHVIQLHADIRAHWGAAK